MGKWIWERLSKLYTELSKDNWDWSSLDLKAAFIVLLAIIGLAIWKRKVWLRPLLRMFSYLENNKGREKQLNVANQQLKDIYEKTLNTYNKLQKNQNDFSSSANNIRGNLSSMSKSDGNRTSTTLIKAQKAIKNDVEKMSEIYLESFADLNLSLKIMRENIERAKFMEISRNETLNEEMKDYPRRR